MTAMNLLRITCSLFVCDTQSFFILSLVMRFLNFLLLCVVLFSMAVAYNPFPADEKLQSALSFRFHRRWPECVGIDADEAVKTIRGDCSYCSVVVMNEVSSADAS